MVDLLLIGAGAGFIALCALAVRFCAHLIGPDTPDAADSSVPAGAPGASGGESAAEAQRAAPTAAADREALQ